MQFVQEEMTMSSSFNQLSIKSPAEKIELENQFIIRFPEDLSHVVLKAIEMGNINETLSINMEEDMRHGEVLVNNQLLYAKLVDLPTVVESYKTTDNTNLYKTADICQMLVCGRNPPNETDKQRLLLAKKIMEQEQKRRLGNESVPDYEDMQKKRGRPTAKSSRGRPRKYQFVRKGVQRENYFNERASQGNEDNESLSPNDDEGREYLKVDDKFLWPHGLTPPCRNLRRRRLGNAMKDKNEDSPEPDILREVKYLLRMDCEAVRIKYEVDDPKDVKNFRQLSDSSSESNDTD